MIRRSFLTHAAVLGGAALLAPEVLRAAGQLQAGAVLGVDWGLAFADCDGDLPAAPMTLVSGVCPEGLNGALYRNGPGRFRLPGGSAGHWFDGDGLVRRFRIARGEATLAARFVDTAKRRADTAARAVVTPGYGTTGRPVAAPPPELAGPANLAVLPMGEAIWALWDRGPPIALAAADLSTRGPMSLRADLARAPFLSRPRIEPGGDIWNLGVSGDKAIVWRLALDGTLISTETIDLPCASLVHDFTATRQRLVIVLQPLIQDRAGPDVISTYSWRPQQPTRVLVLDKADLGERRLFELPPFFAFHYGAAWETPDGAIRFDACVADDPSFATTGARRLLAGDWTPIPSPVLSLITLGADGAADLQRTAEGATFPTGDPSVAGWPRAFTVHTGGYEHGPLARTLSVRNWSSQHTEVFDFGPSHLVEEALFAPRPNGRGELDGWLLVPTVNLAAKASELHVLDANRVSEGPLCSWRAAVALPVGLHGAFVPA